MVKIIVDADGCPVRMIAERVAREYRLPVVFVTDYNHVLQSDYARIITVDQSQDSADLKIAQIAEKDDVVVTGDYGLAALALAKGCIAIDFSGVWLNEDNIGGFLLNRHIGMQIRKRGKFTKGPKKRTKQLDMKFEDSLRRWLENNLKS